MNNNSHNNKNRHQSHLSLIKQLRAENQQLKSDNQTLTKRCAHYQAQHDILYHQFQALRRHIFGSKSERYVEDGIIQLDLLNPDVSRDQDAPSNAVDADAHDQAENLEIAGYTRKKRLSKVDRWAHLPRTVVEHTVPDADRICCCGCQKRCIGYDSALRLNYQPAKYACIEDRREKLACPKGCVHSVVIAPLPHRLLPKVSATEACLAHIITDKIEHCQPHYHLEKHTKKANDKNTLISRQTMANWFIESAEKLKVLLPFFDQTMKTYDIASIDATSLQVLNEPNRHPTTKSLVYCLCAGPPDKQMIHYRYHDVGHKVFLSKWLDDFKGYLHCDADTLFDDLESETLKRGFCMAHARRYFEKIVALSKRKGQAHIAMGYIKALYKIERQAKREALTPDQRVALRIEKSKPILQAFETWLHEISPHTMPKSALGVAVRYCLNHWAGLSRFLEDGRLEIDNNLTEQQIKPFVMARKNFLFAATQAGAKALCLHFSLVQTAKAHGLDPYTYYVKLLTELPNCKTEAEIEALLPWHVKHAQSSDQIEQKVAVA